MANRQFSQLSYTLEKQVVNLFCTVNIGSTGAPTLVTANASKGVSTIVRNGVGKYTITLKDTYYKFFQISPNVINTNGIAAAPNFALISQAVNTLAAPTIVIQFSSGGSATELASGDVIYFNITLGNSSAY